MMSKVDDFINKAKEIHGDKYDYSKVDYKNSSTKVKIICPIHGVFEQRASSHLEGAGCQKCAYRDSFEEFVEKARKVHGDKYEYSEESYNTDFYKIKITCPTHGIFIQDKHVHLNGSGCPLCAGNNFKYTREQFIEKARKVHGDKYNYDKVIYENSDTKVVITCPIHGDFEQAPAYHLKGQGCVKCVRVVDTDTFIERAKKVHGDKYDYSKVEYKGVKCPVEIICPEHGSFYQTPHSHLSGRGCYKCNCGGAFNNK